MANDENAKAVPPGEAVPKTRGFGRLTPEQRRALGSKGGTTAHARGTANKFTPDTASAAGRVPHERGTAHKWTAEQAREAGKKGGSTPRSTRASRVEERAGAVPSGAEEEAVSKKA